MLASTPDPRLAPRAATPLDGAPRHYELICAACGTRHLDDGVRLACRAGCGGLLVDRYRDARFAPRAGVETLRRYADWLPGRAHLLSAPLPIATRLPWLCEAFDLPNLRVILSGAWPGYGATSATGSFKDLEADAVLARLAVADEGTALALASAGNTALAFAAAAERAGRRRVIVVVSETTRAALRLARRSAPNLRLVVVRGDARYDDAIALSRALASAGPVVLEGGVRNVARRDGVGAAFLRAVEALGETPAAYVQAVGSAAGAIAVREAAERLRAAGAIDRLPRLVLVQNAPFTPIVDRRRAGSAVFVGEDDATARRRAGAVFAPVLTNLAPPYDVAGGIAEALAATDGSTVAVGNGEAIAMREAFWRRERVLLDPAAAVAAASLSRCAPALRDLDGPVVLHLTGSRGLVGDAPIRPEREWSIRREDVARPDAVDRLREALLG